jgi:hypothetical protein
VHAHLHIRLSTKAENDAHSILHGEQTANYDIVPWMARRPEPEEFDALSAEELKQLRHNLAHLSPQAA